MRVLTLVCPRAAVGRSETGRFLEGSLGGLTLQQHSHTLRRCMATDAAYCIAGGMSPNRRLSGFFTEKLALLERRAFFIQYSKVLQMTAKKVVAKKCFGTQLLLQPM